MQQRLTDSIRVSSKVRVIDKLEMVWRQQA